MAAHRPAQFVGLVVLGVVALAAMALGVARWQSPVAPRDQQLVTICHRTGSDTNPWVFMTIDQGRWPEHEALGDFRASSAGECVQAQEVAAQAPPPAEAQHPAQAQQDAAGQAAGPPTAPGAVGVQVSDSQPEISALPPSGEPVVPATTLAGDGRSAAAASAPPAATATPVPARIATSPDRAERAARASSGPPSLPFTRIIMPDVSLQADVVPAKLADKGGGVTWEVPAFSAGHAEGTAGPGELGNAVLLGHVASRNAGNVFENLDEVRAGDRVQVFSGAQRFDYQVVEVREVARTDASVMRPTGSASLSLITCTGTWLPEIGDYAERLVVRAELADAAPAAVQPAPARTAALRTVLDERFADNRRSWPSDPRATAWIADSAYRLFARQPSRFVAVGAPVAEPLRDVVVTGTFRKVGGPPGGGYGLIVRDRTPRRRDGVDQGGRYYVLEAGDRGELGIWRREGDHWVDLVPWSPSAAVRPGDAPNELTVRAFGQEITFLVNGIEVARQADATLPEGGVGIFVGGDFNEVAVDRLVVQVPN
jgi:LPXTG-site transpeptidase (sortase) family protein